MKPVQRTTTVYSIGQPTNDEQMILELINRARARPDSEGMRLFATTDPDVSSGWTYWLGQNAAETRAQVKADFATYPAQPPLAFSSNLIDAARVHSQDMLDHDYQDHTGSDGSDPVSRCTAAGYVGTYIGENIFAYGTTPLAIHQTFEIDWGPNNVGVLGHRKNIMNFDPNGPHYTEIGIGVIHGGSGSPHVGPTITTQDFGDAGSHFITGVVYDDLNHNGFYDMGEGLGGVDITCSQGEYSAVSSNSGGYTIPFSNTGNVTVTASGGALSSPIVHQINFASKNVKVDFIKDFSLYPYQPTLIRPIADTVINSDTAHFVWGASFGTTKYRIQVATDSQMKKLVLNDSLLKDTIRALGGLKDSTTYYWRVQARNDKGWGQYSLVDKFSVSLPPHPVILISPANNSTVPNTDVRFVWHSTNASDFTFELATDALLANVVTSLNTSGDTSISIPWALLGPATTYYWRVAGQNDVGVGAPSPVWSFKTGADAVPIENAESASVTVVPNPSVGVIRFGFSLPASGPVLLRVYDCTGREVGSSKNGILAAGHQEIAWDGSAVPNGAYVYELQCGESRHRGRFVISK